MKLTYILGTFVIFTGTLNAMILREPPQGCPSIADINTYKTEILNAKPNDIVELGRHRLRLVYHTKSKPSVGIETYTYAITNPDYSAKANCEYSLRTPTQGLVTHYIGFEIVK